MGQSSQMQDGGEHYDHEHDGLHHHHIEPAVINYVIHHTHNRYDVPGFNYDHITNNRVVPPCTVDDCPYAIHNRV